MNSTITENQCYVTFVIYRDLAFHARSVMYVALSNPHTPLTTLCKEVLKFSHHIKSLRLKNEDSLVSNDAFISLCILYSKIIRNVMII